MHTPTVLLVQNVLVSLNLEGTIPMTTTVSVGHKVNFALEFLDQNGNPMLTAPTPNSPPVWTDTTPATETVVAAVDGLTAIGAAIAPGSDTVSVTVVVGGTSFAATTAVVVSPEVQMLTSVAITTAVS
jgi:hypothetical protein